MRNLIPAIVLMAFCGTVNSAGLGCTCDNDEILDNIRTSKTVFYGRVIKAEMASATSSLISVEAEIRDPIFGPRSGTIEFQTTLIGNCGIALGIGAHQLFVVPDDDEPVTRCSGSSLGRLDTWHHLIYALITVAYVDTDPEKVNEWLQRRFGAGYPREGIQRYFELLGELDAKTIIRYTNGEIVYRNLMFVFTDEEMVSFE